MRILRFSSLRYFFLPRAFLRRVSLPRVSLPRVSLPRVSLLILPFFAAIFLSACNIKPVEIKDETQKRRERTFQNKSLGGGPLFSFGQKYRDVESQRGLEDLSAASGSGPAVNAYLWSAALSALSVLPFDQVDSAGGVIHTEWGSFKEEKNAQYKMNVLVIGKVLRADALKVVVFKRRRVKGAWENISLDPQTKLQIEETILTKARELYLTAKFVN